MFQEEERIIDVEWTATDKVSYKVDIEIHSNDRDGLVADIAKEINKSKATMPLINSRIKEERIVETHLTLEVENLEELNKILKSLRKIDSVYEVKRKK